MPKMAKKVTLQLTWMTFIQNRVVFFNQESLPITYHNSITNVWSDRKLNLQGSQPISYKTNFLQRDNIHLADHKKENLSKYLGEN